MAKSKVIKVVKYEKQVSKVYIVSNDMELVQVASYDYTGTTFHQCGHMQPKVLNRIRKTNRGYR